MKTPERALELAERIDPNGFGAGLITGAEETEIAAILRHYAEVTQKNQVRPDAEPTNEAFQQAAMLIADHFDYPWQYMPEQGRADLLGLARKVAAIMKPRSC